MGKLKALDELRELAADVNSTEIIDHLDVVGKFMFHVEWLESWHKAFDAACAEIEREVAERFMALPVDADGVPIRVGDETETFDCPADSYERFIVCAVAPGRVHRWDEHNIGEPTVGTLAYSPASLRHFKPRTIEDVLCEYASKMNDAYNDPTIGGEDRADVLSMITDDYADEIRDLMGGGE